MIRILGGLGALCSLSIGCVEGARRAADTFDSDSASPADGADGEPEALGASCATADDCAGDPSLCRRWECPAGTCQLSDDDGTACDDGDRCTGVGTCAAGVCVPGPALTCEGGTACAYPVCDPVAGCALEVALDGYCQSGRGDAWGSCLGGRMRALDTCVGAEVCEDGRTPLDEPLPKDLVVGRWFVVSQFLGNDVAGKAAGMLDFTPAGSIGGALDTPDGKLELGGVAHDWCLDAHLGVGFDLGPPHFVGQVDPAGEVLGASAPTAKTLLFGVRPVGDAGDVDGLYAALLTGSGDLGELRVWSGYLSFAKGCLTNATFLAANGGRDPLFIADDKACLGVPELGIVPLELTLEDGGALATPLSLYGAIGPRGDVLLLNERTRGAQGFGIFLLVRTSAAAAARVSGRTGWVQLLLEARAGQFLWSFRSPAGALLIDDGRLLNGFFADRFVTGERLVIGADGRFVAALVTTDEHRSYTGFFAPNGGMGFYYEVTPASDWSTVDDVSEIPALPAAGLLMQRPRL